MSVEALGRGGREIHWSWTRLGKRSGESLNG